MSHPETIIAALPRHIPPLIKRHAGDAAFYAAQHDGSAHSPLIDLAQLREFDRLLDAHLDGLTVADELGWRMAFEAADRWQGAAEVFVCASLALRRPQPGEALREVWPLIERDPSRALRGLIGALGWCAPGVALPFVENWIAPASPEALQVAGWRAAELHAAGFAGSVFARLALALRSENAHVRAAACRVAGRAHALDALLPILGDPDTPVAVEAAIALGGRAEGLRAASVLWRGVTALNDILSTLTGRPRAQTFRRLSRWVRHLGFVAPLGHPGVPQLLDALPPRLALQFILHHGDAAHLPWVVRRLADPQCARLAGWVWSALTGVALEPNGLAHPPRALADEEAPRPTDDLDPGLPLPHAEAVAACRVPLPEGVAVLGGAPLDDARIMQLLHTAPQALRWVASQHLRERGLHFDTRAPALRQYAALASLNAAGAV